MAVRPTLVVARVRARSTRSEVFTVSHPMFERHQAKLEKAVEAIRRREFFSAYPEVPSGKIYGETAKADGAEGEDVEIAAPRRLDDPPQRRFRW